MSNSKYYILIDCVSEQIKPCNILISVLKNTKLKSSNFNVVSTSFGNWRFELNNDCDSTDFLNSISIIKTALIYYYINGLIRYAEWYDEN